MCSDKIACLWRVSPGQDASAKMMAVMAGMEGLFSNPLPSFYPKDLLIGAGCGIALRLVVYFKAKNAKKFRHGMEYGSARWRALHRRRRRSPRICLQSASTLMM